MGDNPMKINIISLILGDFDHREDRGRFSVLTKKSVYGIIFKGDNYAKTSSQKK